MYGNQKRNNLLRKVYRKFSLLKNHKDFPGIIFSKSRTFTLVQSHIFTLLILIGRWWRSLPDFRECWLGTRATSKCFFSTNDVKMFLGLWTILIASGSASAVYIILSFCFRDISSIFCCTVLIAECQSTEIFDEQKPSRGSFLHLKIIDHTSADILINSKI